MSRLSSNSLSVSAEVIRALVAESEALAIESIEKAIEAGRLLVIAKGECKHGQWLPFLSRAGVPERKAQRMMQIAKSGLKSDTVSDLGGIKAALDFIAKRKAAADALDAALALIQSSDFGHGMAEIESALALEDELIEMFPEGKRAGMQRHNPEHDAMQIVQRIATIKTAASSAA